MSAGAVCLPQAALGVTKSSVAYLYSFFGKKVTAMKKLKKKTTTLYRFGRQGAGRGTTTAGETDPTNTTITVLTTVSGQTHFAHRPGPVK